MIAVWKFQHLDAEFVAQHTRVVEEGLPTSEGVQVGAADADASDAHQRVAGWGCRCVNGGRDEAPRLGERDLQHGGIILLDVGARMLLRNPTGEPGASATGGLKTSGR